MKKLHIAIAIFTLIMMISPLVFAVTTESFEVVDDQVCTIKLNDYCDFEKKMTSYDLDKRQVTIQLKITNNSPINQPTGEVMLVLDNSASMNDTVDNNSSTTRGDVVFGSAKNLVTKMLTGNDNLKVGIVKFSTTTDISREGTMDDTSLVSELSSDINSLNSAIDSIEKDGPRTDLDAGLTLAGQYFSNENTNKYIIVLTDGVPNVALDASNDYYSEQVISKTKAKLQSLANNYNVVTMLTGISNPNQAAGLHDYDFEYVINNVFGTPTNPSYNGKFYYISDSQIESTLTNDIYTDVLPQSKSITNIKINDFFPQEIVDNFDFAYVSNPTKGTISESIDSDNKIVWAIDDLASGETATVQYTLTLKNNYDPSILNVILDTNEKVDITYKDFDNTDKSKTSTDTPKVRITKSTDPTPTPTPTPNDPTTSRTILPKAGTVTFISALILLVTIAGLSGTRLLKINHDMYKQH